jgi:hypothetical protein
MLKLRLTLWVIFTEVTNLSLLVEDVVAVIALDCSQWTATLHHRRRDTSILRTAKCMMRNVPTGQGSAAWLIVAYDRRSSAKMILTWLSATYE